MRSTHASHAATCACHLDPAFGVLADLGAVSGESMPRRTLRPLVVPTVADTILTVRIVTMSAAAPVVEAVAVTDGRITAVGTRDEIEGLRGPRTQAIDFGDHVAYPGFVEPHMHYWASAMFLGWTDVSTRSGRSYDEVLELLRHTEPVDGWILGRLYDPSLVEGERDLSRDDLDRIHPDTPVFVINASMHWAYVNSAALAAAGIHDDVAQPPGGEYVKRDGRLTGAIGEIAAMAPLMRLLPRQDRSQLETALLDINRRAASKGYTRTHDAATGGLFGPDEPSIMYGLRDRLAGRVSYAMLDQAARRAIDDGMRSGDGDDMARLVHWKVVGDGSNQGYSGYQFEPYLGRDHCGKPNYPTEHLIESIRTGHEHGFPMMIHANGDAAISQTLDAYAAALDGRSGLEFRDRIEHCSYPLPRDLQRMADLGISPSFLIGHVYYWGHVFRDHIMGPEKAARLDPVASAVALGLRASLHSDYTVTEFEPMRELQTAVTRVLRHDGEVLGPAERVPVEVAMRMKTVDAAWQVHADDEGVIEPGRFADLTILDRDPVQVDPDAIGGIGVVRTIVGGRTVYEG
ncbi:MAG: amidohydrolase [Ilumatobacteraceae bacterium]